MVEFGAVGERYLDRRAGAGVELGFGVGADGAHRFDDHRIVDDEFGIALGDLNVFAYFKFMLTGHFVLEHKLDAACRRKAATFDRHFRVVEELIGVTFMPLAKYARDCGLTRVRFALVNDRRDGLCLRSGIDIAAAPTRFAIFSQMRRSSSG